MGQSGGAIDRLDENAAPWFLPTAPSPVSGHPLPLAGEWLYGTGPMVRTTKSGGGRQLTVRVKTSRRRKPSSNEWLTRQLNDPYVAAARRQGYRSRAAFKLQQLDQRFRLLARGARVVDLGCAPGGWSQIAAEKVGAGGPRGGVVVGCDLSETTALGGATLLQGDFRDEAIVAEIRAALGGPADIVLSDMAAPATGHAATDHLRVVGLAEDALALARTLLRPGGVFVAKVFQGGATGELLSALKKSFAEVRHAKPAASRAESAETYVVAKGFAAAHNCPYLRILRCDIPPRPRRCIVRRHRSRRWHGHPASLYF